MRIAVTGTPYFVREVGRIAFDASSWSAPEMPSRRDASGWTRFFETLEGFDVWYRIGGLFARGWMEKYARAVRLGIPVVVHWTGSDVLALARFLRRHAGARDHARRFAHWATAPWLVDELAALGIEASFVPFPIHKRVRYVEQTPPPLPERFAVYTYVPDESPRLYGWGHVRRLARAFPEIDVHVARGEGRGLRRAPRNVHFWGWVEDLDELYARTTVAVRMTRHDGLTGTVQEPLLLERHAVWTYPFPGALRAKSYRELAAHVGRLLDLHRAGRLEPNRDGRRYVRDHLDPNALARDVRDRMRTIAAGRRPRAGVGPESGDAPSTTRSTGASPHDRRHPVLPGRHPLAPRAAHRMRSALPRRG